MAKHRALAGAFFSISLGASSAMFACRGPDSNEYEPPEGLEDASSSLDAARDGMISGDGSASADGLAVPPDASYPLSRCAVDQDVFYLDVEGPAGPLQLGEIMHTSDGAHWFVSLQPELNVMLATETGPVGSIQVWTPSGAPVLPGTYPQGPTSKGPSIDVVVIEEGCQLTSGSFTLLDLQYDWPDTSTSGVVKSLLMSFDLVCDSDTIKGCVRYSE